MTKAERKYSVLPEISYATRPKVLLVGNGLNLSFKESIATDTIIRNEWKSKYGIELPRRDDKLIHHAIWDQAFPMQIVIASQDHVDGCMAQLAKTFKGAQVEPRQKDLIETILSVGFDAILTTNYSLEFEKSTISEATEHKIYSHYLVTEKQTTQQKQFGIFQGIELPYANHPSLWHIHGTSLRRESMVMGQFYYGKLLSEIVRRSNEVAASYRNSIKKGISFTPKSWIDYFLIGDVYCFGFAMDLSESDIWWLMSFKKSAFPDSNFYLYERDAVTGIKEMLFNTYDIKRPDMTSLKGDDYVQFYKNVCSVI